MHSCSAQSLLAWFKLGSSSKRDTSHAPTVALSPPCTITNDEVSPVTTIAKKPEAAFCYQPGPPDPLSNLPPELQLEILSWLHLTYQSTPPPPPPQAFNERRFAAPDFSHFPFLCTTDSLEQSNDSDFRLAFSAKHDAIVYTPAAAGDDFLHNQLLAMEASNSPNWKGVFQLPQFQRERYHLAHNSESRQEYRNWELKHPPPSRRKRARVARFGDVRRGEDDLKREKFAFQETLRLFSKMMVPDWIEGQEGTAWGWAGSLKVYYNASGAREGKGGDGRMRVFYQPEKSSRGRKRKHADPVDITRWPVLEDSLLRPLGYLDAETSSKALKKRITAARKGDIEVRVRYEKRLIPEWCSCGGKACEPERKKRRVKVVKALSGSIREFLEWAGENVVKSFGVEDENLAMRFYFADRGDGTCEVLIDAEKEIQSEG